MRIRGLSLLRAPRAGLFLVTLVAGAAALPQPFDLDVGVPPGSPLDWGRAFPAVTPAPGDLFPKSGADVPAANQRSIAGPARRGVDVRIASSFGLVRVLTWDLAGHLEWVASQPEGPATGSATRPPTPRYGDPVFWVSVVPLLRLLLHPAMVSRWEILGHLVEVGDPVLGVLTAASSEPYLVAPCSRLRSLIASPGDGAPTPSLGASVRETMLRRFVLEELTGAHPFDPEGGFGRRLFLFADEVESYVRDYGTHKNAFVRRNAVLASGRYSGRATLDALLASAVKTADPVVLARALAALPYQRGRADWQPLVQRLAASQDPVETTLLVGAVGRLGIAEALPELMALGARARGGPDLEADTDLLMTVLSSLGMLGSKIDEPDVLAFLEELGAAARRQPRLFDPSGEKPAVRADVPDTKDTRGLLLAQLALVARVRVAPDTTADSRRLLALLRPAPQNPRVELAGPRRNQTLGGVLPPVRFLFLEALAGLDDAGREGLLSVAGDRTVEPALRGHALSLFSGDARDALALRLVRSDAEEPGMKIQAFGVIAATGHPELRAVSRELVAAAAALPSAGGPAEARYLGLRGLRALSQRGELTTADVLPLMHHVRAPQASFARLPEEVRELVVALAFAAADGAPGADLERRIDEILALVKKHGVNPELAATSRTAARNTIKGRLASLRAHRDDAGYFGLVVDEILEYVLGWAQPRLARWRAEFEPTVLFEEEILLSLGRTRSPAAAEVLMGLLRNRANVHRGVACLALGMTDQRASAASLMPLLLDEDAFVRLCASESLRHLTGHEVEIDWMYAPPGVRAAAAERVKRWMLENR